MDLISVIMPTYNRAAYVASAIESVLGQTHREFELIIIDDGSTDNTEDIVAPFLGDGRVRYVVQENAGAAAARNRGLEEERGRYVAFIDSDDTWESEKLEIQLAVMNAIPQVGIVCSDFYSLNSEGRGERSHIKSYFSVFNDYGIDYKDVFTNVLKEEVDGLTANEKVYWGNIYETMIFGNVILTSTTLIREEIFQPVGVFDTKYETLEDYDLYMRMTRKFPVAFVDKPLVCYRYSDNQLSGEALFEKLCRNLEDIFLKNVNSIEDEDFIKKNGVRLNKHLGLIHATRACFYFNHDSMSLARDYYWKSLRKDPGCLKHYLYLIATLLPPQLIRLMRKLKTIKA